MNLFKKEISRIILNNKHIIFYGVLCLFFVSFSLHAQNKQLRKDVLKSQQAVEVKRVDKKKSKENAKVLAAPAVLAPTVNPLANNKTTLIYLENSETLSFDKLLNPDVQVLKGNVRFRHDNALLYCDSAYFYEKANSLDAYGHVKMVQGDTLFVYGDFLFYDGNEKLARLRHNVRLENRKTTLTTDSLNYSRITNLAYYYTGGKIKDELNLLTSVWGQYSPRTNEAIFKNNVHLKNKNFTLDADTLKYNTKSNIANIVGKTHIVYNEEADIYSTRGWYNTSTEQSMLLDRSIVKNKDGKSLTGDTVFYDKKNKFGEGFRNVILLDSIQKGTLYGDYIYYNENSEVGIATDSALLEDWSSKDTMYVHADTLYTSKDSIYNVARGYYNVRIFRNDVQGLCDSLAYSDRDSVMNLYGEPVMWAENNQLSGEFIQAFTKNKQVDRISIQRAAMAVQHEDSIYFNQLSGKEIVAYMDSGQLKRVNVNGNAETIYYPKDDKDSTLLGVNKTQSSYVALYLKDKKVERIVMTTATVGTMYPLNQLSGGDLYLKNYFWLENQRPKNKADLFTIYPKTTRVKIGTSSMMGKSSSSESSDSKPKNASRNNESNSNSSSNKANLEK